MLSIDLFGLALPLNPLLMMAGWWLASWLTDRWMRPYPVSAQRQAARALLLALVLGLVVSRAGFVALAWPAYTTMTEGGADAEGGGAGFSLRAVLNVRDGGWMPWAGLAAALGVLGATAWRHPLCRRALLLGPLGGLVFWAVSSTALGVHQRPALPALALTALDGTPVALHGQSGAPLVVNLWASWCAPCLEEMPHFARAQQRHRDIRFVFLNHGEDRATVQRFLHRQPYTLANVVMDEQRRWAAAIGTQGLPTTLFVDSQGRVVDRHFGPLSAASLQARLMLLR